MNPVYYSESISAEAGAWLARLQACDYSIEDQRAFRLWLESDPSHAAAFKHAANVWDRLGTIPRDLYVPKTYTVPTLSRRTLIAACAGITVLGTSVAFLRSARAKEYQTAIGEQKRIPLDDGSVLFLDTNTSLTVELSAERRLVNLRYGRVNCRMAQNNRQFAVKTTDCLVVGKHSLFDVSDADNSFSLLLISGDAEVGSSASGSVTLRPGDMVTITPTKPLQRDRPDLSLLTAWQTGRLVFKNETVLKAVEQVNRYSTTKIEVDDSNVASLRMSGGYAVGDSIGFAEALSKLLPVDIRQADGKIKLTSRSDI